MFILYCFHFPDNKLFESSTTLAIKNEQLKVEAAKLKEENISLHIRGDAR